MIMKHNDNVVVLHTDVKQCCSTENRTLLYF